MVSLLVAAELRHNEPKLLSQLFLKRAVLLSLVRRDRFLLGSDTFAFFELLGLLLFGDSLLGWPILSSLLNPKINFLLFLLYCHFVVNFCYFRWLNLWLRLRLLRMGRLDLALLRYTRVLLLLLQLHLLHVVRMIGVWVER